MCACDEGGPLCSRCAQREDVLDRPGPRELEQERRNTEASTVDFRTPFKDAA